MQIKPELLRTLPRVERSIRHKVSTRHNETVNFDATAVDVHAASELLRLLAHENKPILIF